MIERARLRRLAWSDAAAVRELAADALRAPPRCAARSWRTDSPPERALPGFDLALGADVVYVAEAVPALFAAAATLLSASPEVGKQKNLAINSCPRNAGCPPILLFATLHWTWRWARTESTLYRHSGIVCGGRRAAGAGFSGALLVGLMLLFICDLAP